MKTLGDIMWHISRLQTPVPFISISVEHWEKVRDECRFWCEENDQEFTTDPLLVTPNFMVHGIPVIAAGHA